MFKTMTPLKGESAKAMNRRLMPNTAALVDELRAVIGDIRVLYAQEGEFETGKKDGGVLVTPIIHIAEPEPLPKQASQKKVALKKKKLQTAIESGGVIFEDDCKISVVKEARQEHKPIDFPLFF
jgi:hypothetical protein